MAFSPESIIETICPELFGSPSLQFYLGMAVERVDQGYYRHVYNQAVAYRACHDFTKLAPSNGKGKIRELGDGAPISSITEGGMSVSFSQPSSATDIDDLNATKYGRMLLALKKSMPRLGVNRAGGNFL
jgi:hypothetical protein